MDKIREALKALVEGKKSGLFSCDVEADTEEELEAKIEDARERWALAEAALSAPVASDAPELAESLWDLVHMAGGPMTEECAMSEAAAEIERYAADRELKAREDEREACAERAEIFYRSDCGGCGEFEQWPCHVMPNDSVKANCTHVKMLRAAIKEATK